jgi:hypothetical protein
MATITLRGTKGSPLTNAEVDANFSNINTEVGTKLNTTSYTAADVLAKLLTVDGVGSGLDADTLDGLASATANTVSTIVARDASGNFSAGTITATNFSGTHSGAASITSGTITGITDLTILDGGTGSSTASGARTNLGLAIGTDVQAYDPELAALASVTSAADTAPYFTGAGTASTYSLTAFGRSLGASAAAINARSTLGLVIGSDVQSFDADLSAIGAISTNGIIVRTGAGAAAARTIAQGAGITISNGDGVAGNPTIAANVTSVQGLTGDVTVTTISGNAGSASTVSGVQTTMGTTGSALTTQNAGQSGPQVLGSGGGGAVWSMHRPGAYGLNIGLDTDNIFRIGGWSAANNRLQMDMTGNLTMSGNVTAFSDERLKKNWNDLPAGFVESLANVKMGTYERIDSGEIQVGVSAQSLQPVMPQAINVDADGMLSVSYGNAALAAAVAMAREIVELKARLAKLEG